MFDVKAGVIGALTVCLFIASAAPTPAQTTRLAERPVEVGLAAGVFVDYPSRLAQPYCEQRAGGVMGHGVYWAFDAVGVEGSLVASDGYGEESCPDLSRAPTPVGQPFDRNRYADDEFGARLVSTGLGLVIEPFRGVAVSPRVRLGLGRIWTHDRAYGFLGGGFRFQFGRHALLMDVEWWRVSIDLRRETVVFTPATGYEVLSSELFEQTESPYLVRVGWGMTLGR